MLNEQTKWKKIKQDFLQRWTLEKVEKMTLEEYTNLNKSDSFTYWLESKTTDIVSMWGGSSYKFGIFKRDVSVDSNELTKGRGGDNEYGWYRKYGHNREEVFNTVKSYILQIIKASQDEKFNEIDDIDLGTAYKWKIAFMYADDEKLLRIVSKDAFEFLAQKYDIKFKAISQIQQSLINRKPNTVNFYDYSKQLWDEYDKRNNNKNSDTLLNQPTQKSQEEQTMSKADEKQIFIADNIDYNFTHKNLLLKGVLGTGKSQTIENIIANDLQLNTKELQKNNVCRINIHSASSNADLMQGIGINSNGGTIEYKEKQGLIYNHIKKALFTPNQPFVLVLEEIQENSLNELIGDLIYLIEDKKRVEVDTTRFEDRTEYDYQEFIEEVLKIEKNKHYIEIPNLVDASKKYRKMVLPFNLYLFCTSNYRDDKKVIEDNLLRRFDVVEIYPKYDEEIYKSKEIPQFLELLNNTIIKQFEAEIHPDRYMIGHANWLDITDENSEDNQKLFYTALLKVIIEFKEIREVEFESYTKEILEKVLKDSSLSERLQQYIEDCKFDLESDRYKEIVEKLQNKIYDFVE